MTHILLRAIPLAIVVIGLASAFAWYDSYETHVDKMSISSMYSRTHAFENNGPPRGGTETPLSIYTRIIEIDRTEEPAWHEKGRLLNKSEMCAESALHYRQYIKEFPNSIRADEGYEIAKKCGVDEN